MNRARAGLLLAGAVLLVGVGAPAGWAQWDAGAATRHELATVRSLVRAPDLAQQYAAAQAHAPRTGAWSSTLSEVTAAASAQGLALVEHEADAAGDLESTWVVRLSPDPQSADSRSVTQRAAALSRSLALAPRQLDVTQVHVTGTDVELTLTAYQWPSR